MLSGPKVGEKRTRNDFEILDHNTLTSERVYNLSRKYQLNNYSKHMESDI